MKRATRITLRALAIISWVALAALWMVSVHRPLGRIRHHDQYYIVPPDGWSRHLAARTPAIEHERGVVVTGGVLYFYDYTRGLSAALYHPSNLVSRRRTTGAAGRAAPLEPTLLGLSFGVGRGEASAVFGSTTQYSVPLWLPMLVLAWPFAAPHVAAWRVRRGVGDRRGTFPSVPRCRRCGYDLRATPGRCPECGPFVRPPR